MGLVCLEGCFCLRKTRVGEKGRESVAKVVVSVQGGLIGLAKSGLVVSSACIESGLLTGGAVISFFVRCGPCSCFCIFNSFAGKQGFYSFSSQTDIALVVQFSQASDCLLLVHTARLFRCCMFSVQPSGLVCYCTVLL